MFGRLTSPGKCAGRAERELLDDLGLELPRNLPPPPSAEGVDFAPLASGCSTDSAPLSAASTAEHAVPSADSPAGPRVDPTSRVPRLANAELNSGAQTGGAGGSGTESQTSGGGTGVAAASAWKALAEEDAALRALLAARQPGTSWRLDAGLAALLGTTREVVAARRPGFAPGGGGGIGIEDPAETEWATACCISLLRLRWHDRASLWAPLVERRQNGMPPVLLRVAMEACCDWRRSGVAPPE